MPILDNLAQQIELLLLRVGTPDQCEALVHPPFSGFQLESR
jgi:hypothetical protein